jgi:hypothetical protein
VQIIIQKSIAMRTFLLHLTIFSLLLCSNALFVSASSPDRKALFIKNVGQVTHSIPGAPDDVLYYAHFDQVTIFITPYSIAYQFNDGKFRMTINTSILGGDMVTDDRFEGKYELGEDKIYCFS